VSVELVIRLTADGEAASMMLDDGTRGVPEWTPAPVKQADTAGRLLLGDGVMVRDQGRVREYRTQVRMEWQPVVPPGPTPR
jgi:hypothetical protein